MQEQTMHPGRSLPASSPLHRFQGATRVGIHGSQQFTNVQGDMNIHPAHPTPSDQQPHGLSKTAAKTEDTASRSICSESANYCSHLLRQGRGFPLYVPGPQKNLPEKYQRNGVAIGDVGRVTPEGMFEFFFNIYHAADDAMNVDFVPDGFSPLPRYVPRDIVPVEFGPRNYVSSSSVRGWWNGYPKIYSHQFIAHDFLFTCTGPSGAVLVLPHGAHLEKLANVEPVRRYAAANAESWYEYINGSRGRGLANGSLYLITGCEKAQTGGMASFQNVARDAEFQLSFEPTTDAYNGYNYRFQTETPARTKHFADHSDGEQHSLNQTVFIHGFSISLGEEIWGRLFGNAADLEITDSRMRNTQNSVLPFGSFFSWPLGIFGWGGATDEQDVTISDFSPSSETVHPARAINSFLLHKRPEAAVVITHDDDWRDTLRDDGTQSAIKNTRELLQQISEQFMMREDAGTIYLVSKSSTIPRFLPSLRIPSVSGRPSLSTWSGLHSLANLIDANSNCYDDGCHSEEFEAPDGPECSHCHTHRTSVWRRDKDGKQVCNACGVYKRLRGVERPLDLVRNKVKPRQKYSTAPATHLVDMPVGQPQAVPPSGLHTHVCADLWGQPAAPEAAQIASCPQNVPTSTAGASECSRANSEDEVVIVVMGPMGSGKTTFINTVSGANVSVRDDLGSCANTIRVGNPFEVDGRWVRMVNTHAFDDTAGSMAEILAQIAAFLAQSGSTATPAKLSGAIYIHRIEISDMQATGTFQMFKQLCGDNGLKNIVIVTNMWGEVRREVGEAREARLASGNEAFKPLLDKGAHLLRHDNGIASAHAILKRVPGNYSGGPQIKSAKQSLTLAQLSVPRY